VPGVYISYPFCTQKCTYCNFASGVLPRELEIRYVAALRRDLAGADWPWTPETVYLGGGTPSSLDPADLAALLALIPGRPWKESTLETAPGGVTLERAALWREAGITRVSLGVQSFVDQELRRTGRKHNAEIVAREVALLREAGIHEINIDLIAGLPGQTAAGWRHSLDWVERLAVPHVSVYMLEVDEDSRLGLEILQGGLRYGAADVPDEEQIAGSYEIAVERLSALGVPRYEISNFARPGHESLHNLKYWRLEPYFGFGADAHSCDGVTRWQSVESAQDYVARIEAGESARLSSAPAVPEEERFFLGLRLSEGVLPSPEEWELRSGAIRRFLDAGLLEVAGERLRLTGRGVLLSNEVFQEFVAP
jgi:oxygen-independent coproporphyrinogen III oxidase